MINYKEIIKELKEKKVNIAKLLIADEYLDCHKEASNEEINNIVEYTHSEWLDNPELQYIEEAMDKHIYNN